MCRGGSYSSVEGESLQQLAAKLCDTMVKSMEVGVANLAADQNRSNLNGTIGPAPVTTIAALKPLLPGEEDSVLRGEEIGEGKMKGSGEGVVPMEGVTENTKVSLFNRNGTFSSKFQSFSLRFILSRGVIEN